MSKEPLDNSQLSRHRAAIDAIDDDIARLLLKRCEIVREVGQLKHATAPGICPLRPGREAEQLRRMTELFSGTLFKPEAAAAMWRTMINASLAIEGDIRISVFATEKEQELYWLTREYFGTFIAINKEPGVKRVIGDIVDGKSSIGVIPLVRGDDSMPWWPDLAAGGPEYPKIFARIPFADDGRQHFSSGNGAGFAIGRIEPESTGDDITLIALQTDDSISMHKLQTLFSQSRLEAQWVDVLSRIPHIRMHLVEIKGFVSPMDARFQTFLNAAGNAMMHAKILGAYATPLHMQKAKEPRSVTPA